MKPLSLTIVIVFLLNTGAIAQEKSLKYNNTINHAGAIAEERWLTYYNAINKAELAICDSNFAEANKYYKDAFAVNPQKPFGGDLCNAFFSAIDTREYALAEKYLKQLPSRGIETDSLKNKIERYYTGEQLQRSRAMMANYTPVKIKDEALVRKLKQMVKWDQGVRMYYSSLYDGAYMVDSTYTVDSINAHELFKIIKEKGFPSEAVLRKTGYDIVIVHNTGASFSERPAHIFDTLMYKAIINFDYNPYSFAELVQRSALSPSFKFGNIVLDLPLTIGGCYYRGKYYPEYYDEASEKAMNEERAKIGIGSLDDFRKKLEALNAVESGNSVLSKYSMAVYITVMDVISEESFKQWMQAKGKDAFVKRPVMKWKDYQPQNDRFDIGILGEAADTLWGFTIGQKSYAAKLKFYKRHYKEYSPGQVTYKAWKNRDRRMIYRAEVVGDPDADLSKETGRHNKARFVPGYKMLVQDGGGFNGFVDLEIIYDTDSSLIGFIAGVDPGFYKYMVRHFGAPANHTEKCDTVNWPANSRHTVILKTKTFAWKKGNNQTEIILTDKLNDKGMKRTYGTYLMTDNIKYAAYLKKVDDEKERLDKEYPAKKN